MLQKKNNHILLYAKRRGAYVDRLSSTRGDYMLLFRDLMWFFKLEKKSYGLGILVLLFVAIINLFPPYAVRILVDGVDKENLTQGILLKWSLLLLLVGFLVYGLSLIHI